jgi:hypothetical protein
MVRLAKLLFLTIVAFVALAVVGCNERLDDPTQAEGILSIEEVDPSTVKADITPTDPNTGLPTPLANDDTAITLKNRPRSESAGPLGDIFIEKSERTCNTIGGGFIASGTGAGGFTIPLNGSASVTTTTVTAFEKANTGAAVGDSWKCYIRFLGHDLAGNPIVSDTAIVIVNFVDK